MKVLNININQIPQLNDEICAAIGNFDGLHLGHQKLIEESKKHGYKSAVLTFFPHPSVYLKGIFNYELLTPIEHKIEIIEKMGIEYMIIIEFNQEMAKMDRNDFILLLKKLNIKACVCGYDFSFGYKAQGSIKDLKKEFALFEVEKFILNDIRVSSTYIRELLNYGEVALANKFLGRTYSLKGEIIYGNQVGTKIGFPTANIKTGKYFLPKNGVYAVKVKYKNQFFLGMLNIGNNPTINFVPEKRVEVHILEFNQMIYGEMIEVFFYSRIRSEKKFNSKEELLQQLNADREQINSMGEKILEI